MAADLSIGTIKEWQINNLPYKVMWMDIDGKIIYANSKFCKRLGYSSTELLKLDIFKINPTATAESWKSHWEEVEAKGMANFKTVHQTKGGKYYDVEVFAQFF